MGYITRARYEDVYDDIRRNSLKSNNSCLIFVAQDVDALCACRMLVGLLKADFIAYKVVPVSSYMDITNINKDLIHENEELRSIILLNCGGLVDLSEFLTLSTEMTAYVIDSHRPYNLQNCFANDRVTVLDDGDIEEEMQEERQAFEMLEFEDVDEDDEDSEEDEDDADADTNGQAEEGAGGEDEDRYDDGNDRPRQRRRTGIDTEVEARGRRQEKMRKLRDNRQMIANYYSSGTSYGTSIAGQVYWLANALARSTNDTIWLAIIGLTSQFIFENISRDKYNDNVDIFQDEVARFNMRSDSQDSGVCLSSLQSAAEDMQIRREKEYRFMLFRHWSLYDSFYHSSYVASKLGIWRDKGRNRLRNLFAKMGFSFQQCTEVYMHMDAELKRILQTNIEKIAPSYGLVDMDFTSFRRTFGYKGSLCASDVVYSLASMLECSPEVSVSVGAKMDWAQHDDFIDVEPNKRRDEDYKDQEEVREDKEKMWRLRSFYTAYDALDNFELLQSGLQLCMKLQPAIVRQGTAIIDKQSIKTIKTFRFVVIKEGVDMAVFRHPLTLSKLCLFLVDAYREHGRRNLPFVVAALNESNDSYLVVGITGAPSFGDVRKNHFGLAFQKSAEITGARVKHDSFETSVLEVRKDDLSTFVEHLQLRS